MKNWKLNITLLSFLGLGYGAVAQMAAKKHVRESYWVDGNCGMCKKTIETAALKKASFAKWDKDTKQLTIGYNPQKTEADEILKNIAYAGYDNVKYLAPANAYNALPECCRYERSEKARIVGPKDKNSATKESNAPDQIKGTELDAVYDAYFAIKEALVKSELRSASDKAKELMRGLVSVKMDALTTDQHQVFMNHLSFLKSEAAAIAENKTLADQRAHFSDLSEHLFLVVKTIKPNYIIYREHCPMYNDGKGADWLSRESQIKNPYYGSQMMTCGKVVETIK